MYLLDLVILAPFGLNSILVLKQFNSNTMYNHMVQDLTVIRYLASFEQGPGQRLTLGKYSVGSTGTSNRHENCCELN